MDKHKAVIEILSAAKQDIKAILTDDIDHLHALRIDTALSKTIDAFGLHTGNHEAFTSTLGKIGPATSFMGEELEVGTPQKTAPSQLKPTEQEKAAFKAEVDNAYELLTHFPTEQILSGLDSVQRENVIRGVARKAGLKVTSTDHIDAAFIDLIKDAIDARNITENRPPVIRTFLPDMPVTTVDEKTAQAEPANSPAPETPVTTDVPADKIVDEKASAAANATDVEKTAQQSPSDLPGAGGNQASEENLQKDGDLINKALADNTITLANNKNKRR